MFEKEKKYSKALIYQILGVPVERQNGAWDTGYREYDGNIYVFANVGIAGRTGHDYNNRWDGNVFHWEAKNNTTIHQPQIQRMVNPPAGQYIHLFTRSDNQKAFSYHGPVTAISFENTSPVRISWKVL